MVLNNNHLCFNFDSHWTGATTVYTFGKFKKFKRDQNKSYATAMLLILRQYIDHSLWVTKLHKLQWDKMIFLMAHIEKITRPVYPAY